LALVTLSLFLAELASSAELCAGSQGNQGFCQLIVFRACLGIKKQKWKKTSPENTTLFPLSPRLKVSRPHHPKKQHILFIMSRLFAAAFAFIMTMSLLTQDTLVGIPWGFFSREVS